MYYGENFSLIICLFRERFIAGAAAKSLQIETHIRKAQLFEKRHNFFAPFVLRQFPDPISGNFDPHELVVMSNA